MHTKEMPKDLAPQPYKMSCREWPTSNLGSHRGALKLRRKLHSSCLAKGLDVFMWMKCQQEYPLLEPNPEGRNSGRKMPWEWGLTERAEVGA